MKITHLFDQSQLDALIEKRLSWYYCQTAAEAVSGGRSPYGALVRVSADNGVAFVKTALEHAALGYEFKDTNFVQLSPGYSYADFIKPAHMQAEDIEAIKAELEAKYNEQRRLAYEAHKLQIIQESLDRERRAAERKAAEAEEKLVAKLEIQAVAALGGEFE